MEPVRHWTRGGRGDQVSKFTPARPPNGEIVEARLNGRIVRARAIYGDRDKGIRPHWESEDGNLLWAAEPPTAWRATRPTGGHP